MGVKLLDKFLTNNFYENGVYDYHISMLSNKKVCIDTSIFLYKYGINQKVLLKNIYKLCNIFKSYNIIPIFIFDGEPPEIKKNILLKRKINRNKAKEEYDKLIKTHGNCPSSKLIQTKLKILSYNSIKISKNDILKVKHLIDLCGYNYMDAKGEADELCVTLVKSKMVYGCFSDDMDLFTYGSRHVYRNFDIETGYLKYYNLNTILKRMNMTEKDFTLFCIISGTDYYESPHNIFYNYKMYQKFLNSNKKNYYFWLIHNKYIDDANCKLLDINELFDIKPYYILSQYHQSIKINNKRVRLNEINKLLTR